MSAVADLIEAMRGVEHFKDALDFRNDPLSKALRQWIEAGSSALEKLEIEPPDAWRYRHVPTVDWSYSATKHPREDLEQEQLFAVSTPSHRASNKG